MQKFTSVADYLEAHSEWQKELYFLREILISTELQETVKWGAPVYTFKGKNIVGLSAFKSYVGLWFFQGVFLSDSEGLLINSQEEKTKAMRQMRYNSINEMEAKKILNYVNEAIQNQKEGKEIKIDCSKPISIPPELQGQFDQNRDLLASFNGLSKSKRRDYAEYISEAKRMETKHKRLEKIIPMILKSVGLNDAYK